MIIKQSPEDFIVKEIPDFNTEEIKNNKGAYAIYRLKKINLNTEQAIEFISEQFKINRNNIKYAGTKDKNAITTQYISIYKNKGNLNVEQKTNTHFLSLEFIGFLEEPLSLGSLIGNSFEIIVRDAKENLNIKNNSFKIPNYFDEQRFSTNNVEIGLSILRKNYKEAIAQITSSEGYYEHKLEEYIEKNPTDFVGALRKIPKKIITMYLHSVQSFIFNKALSIILKKEAKKNNFEYFETKYSQGHFTFYKNPEDYEAFIEKTKINQLEMFGFGTEIINDEIKTILNELQLTERDFIVRAIPDLSVEGSFRECFAMVKDFEINKISQGTYQLIFSLPKGSYATIVLKQLLI